MSSIILFAFVKLLMLLQLVSCVIGKSSDTQCATVTAKFSNIVEFNCIGLTTLLSHTKEAPKNTTAITIFNAQIARIPRRTFVEFGATLQTVDLQKCGIETIDREGFSDLYFLTTLNLRENKLTRINGDSFRNLYRLQHLDISFNNILFIDTAFYQQPGFPYLQNFYFDYNQFETIDYSLFSLFPSLRKVKFGRNPWKWGYRLLLTQQLDNARVDYRDDWEEWGWMSNAVRECQDNGKGVVPSDTILDCVTLKILHMDVGTEHVVSQLAPDNSTLNIFCLSEATSLIDCHLRSSPPAETMRKTFEGLTETLKYIGPSNGKVSSVTIH